MELVALFNNKPDADEDTIVNALNKHLCRCTGYEAIKGSALLARQLIKERRS